MYYIVSFVVQSLSHIWLFVTPWTTECQVSLSFNISWSLLKFMSIELVMLSVLSFSGSLFFAFNLSQHHGLFPVSWLFTSGSQSIGASASASVLPVNTQGWLTGLISLLFKGLSRVFTPAPQFENINSLVLSTL